MEDEFVSISPDRFGGVKREPYVTRLPDGHVRMAGTSVLFPEFCPRCGGTPAETNVRLHFAKDNRGSIKIPFCRRCAWTLNLTQYAFAALMCVLFLYFFPRFKFPHYRWLAVPDFVPVIVVCVLLSMIFEQFFKLVFKPRVEVVMMWKDSAELAFEDQMYAEKFVELNR
jgi:hypothetical protein